jgi:hypothetical protein
MFSHSRLELVRAVVEVTLRVMIMVYIELLFTVLRLIVRILTGVQL